MRVPNNVMGSRYFSHYLFTPSATRSGKKYTIKELSFRLFTPSNTSYIF